MKKFSAFPFLFFFLITFYSAAAASSSSSSTIVLTTKDVFILAGQNDMVGFGGLLRSYFWDEVVPQECEPDQHILRLGLNMKWEEAREPLHLLEDTPKPLFGIGPGIPFARTLLQRNPAIEYIGLVPCAVSGSYLANWSRDSSYYTNMLARARAAAKSNGAVLRAFLWFQGESDSTVRSEAEAYRRRLRDLFVNVRTDLKAPSLPIIEVALAAGGPNKDKIREAQLKGTELPGASCIDADGLPLIWDNLHLNTTAQIRLGSELADEYLKFPSGVGVPVPEKAYVHACVCLCLLFLVF